MPVSFCGGRERLGFGADRAGAGEFTEGVPKQVASLYDKGRGMRYPQNKEACNACIYKIKGRAMKYFMKWMGRGMIYPRGKGAWNDVFAAVAHRTWGRLGPVARRAYVKVPVSICGGRDIERVQVLFCFVWFCPGRDTPRLGGGAVFTLEGLGFRV